MVQGEGPEGGLLEDDVAVDLGLAPAGPADAVAVVAVDTVVLELVVAQVAAPGHAVRRRGVAVDDLAADLLVVRAHDLVVQELFGHPVQVLAVDQLPDVTFVTGVQHQGTDDLPVAVDLP